ncbi:hypothetical protein [Natronosalvus rutilus]|uniref:Uncharacterized protein n=1 Tax=Natronosalvus rutilus TaxID=2953753 RepID=A0A9E7SVE6_9EURY|nr:hypothetical protein [Natronosalvus rutilus]UTF52931.1 hypothetical protein NGM29_14265 [Natronosalvus rutilus]
MLIDSGSRSDGRYSRRRLLALVGLAATTALAGCTGGTDESDGDLGDEPDGDGDGTDGSTDDSGDANVEDENDQNDESDDGDVIDSCASLEGAWIPFDQGNRSFPIHFDHPDTFEQYNEGINESESGIGAQLGHVGSKESASYPVNVLVQQHKHPTDDKEATTNWVTGFGTNELIDWTFTYEGEQIDVYQSIQSSEENRQWRFLLPAHDGDGVRGVIVQFQDDRDEEACIDGIETVATSLIESLRPNLDYAV